MKRRRVIFALCGGLIMAATASNIHAPTAADDDARQLVGRVATTYGTMENYLFEGTFSMVVQVKEFVQRVDAPFIMAVKAPGKFLQEIEHEALGVLVVCDGDTTWRYLSVFNQYRREAAIPIRVRMALGGGQPGSTKRPKMTGPESFLSFFVGVGSDDVTPRSIGKETVVHGGLDVECDVVEVTYAQHDSLDRVGGPDTLWIDPQNALVLQSVHHVRGGVQGLTTEMTLTFEFDVALTGWTPADSLFVFEPPEGARLVADFTSGRPSTDLSGEAAPDFKLEDLKGKSHSLSSYSGKVVLVDFWATWCAPCRKELPVIEKLQRTFGSSGLVVLAVTTEKQKVVEDYIEKHKYTFPVLFDSDSSVFDDYQVASIPVVIVVDRKGTIVDHFIGLRKESELLEALRRAGIDN